MLEATLPARAMHVRAGYVETTAGRPYRVKQGSTRELWCCHTHRSEAVGMRSGASPSPEECRPSVGDSDRRRGEAAGKSIDLGERQKKHIHVTSALSRADFGQKRPHSYVKRICICVQGTSRQRPPTL